MTWKPTQRVVLLATFVLLASPFIDGRADAPKPTPKPERKAPERFQRDDVQRMHMHESFDLVRAIERLLLIGKLDEAKRFAAAISEAPDAPAHGAWAAHVVAVRDRAASLARATSVEQGCRLVASLASACASCHVETGVEPVFRVFPVPPDKMTLEARMARHRWAADRMWEGIIGGADEPWRAGLDVLAAAPLDSFPSDRTAYARTLQRLADSARKQKAATIETRSKAYGEILVTCASCHTSKPASTPLPPAAK
ncbi:MAG: hypothetical protein ACKV2T_21355 [Kofleriaceae bacterium]